tara:strand:- start:169 stop:1437 length:1269 start_codon:yes stop_codon:yes gene_type:complete
MSKFFINNNFLKKEIVFFLILYFTLLLGFIFGENSTGGAIIDYLNQKKISEDFAKAFGNTFLNYDSYTTRHSPVLIIFLSFFEKLKLSDNLIRFIHLNLALCLPWIFYSCLKLKYDFIKKETLLLLVSLIFISPTFRSLSIWPDSRLLGLALFSLSIYFYLKFNKEKKFRDALFNVFFCASSAYISPNFSIFSFYFFLNFAIFYKSRYPQIIKLFFLNIILSLPALYYVFFLDINFLNKPAAVSAIENNNIFFDNIFNNLLLILSIIYFYLLPFIFFSIIKLNKVNNIKNIILSLIITAVSIFFFDYEYSYTGGGIFYKASIFLFQNNILFFVISFISILVILNLSSNNLNNLLLIFLLFISNPQITVYHKYYDPFLLILFFTIFKLDLNLKNLNKNKNFNYIFLFFFIFLIINNIKYIWTI